jgi:hypothetical protein
MSNHGSVAKSLIPANNNASRELEKMLNDAINKVENVLTNYFYAFFGGYCVYWTIEDRSRHIENKDLPPEEQTLVRSSFDAFVAAYDKLMTCVRAKLDEVRLETDVCPRAFYAVDTSTYKKPIENLIEMFADLSDLIEATKLSFRAV